VLVWVGGGCASPPPETLAPRRGEGIEEFRAVVREAQTAVGNTVKSLDELAEPGKGALLQHPALPTFDRALHRLEVTSIRTRARAEAIIARGKFYFDEWSGRLSTSTNREIAEAELPRYASLLERFGRIRERSGVVREEFRPFMQGLREFRARVDRPSANAGEAPETKLAGLRDSGRRVLRALEEVDVSLKEAQAELAAAR
jgi:hypothetical protein